MRLDLQNMLCDQQAVTTGTQVSTNSLDTLNGLSVLTDTLGNTPPNDPARSPEVEIFVQVTTTFAGGTSLQVNLIQSASSNLSSPTVLQSTPVLVEATLVAGYNFRIAIPAALGISQQYLGLQFVTVGTHSAGKISAGIVGRGMIQNAPGTAV